VEILYVNNSTRKGIDNLRKTIEDTAKKQKYNNVPNVYFTLEKALIEEKTDSFLLSKFRLLDIWNTQISKLFNYPEEELWKAVNFLHDLGSIAYFTDTKFPILQDYVVVKVKGLIQQCALLLSQEKNTVLSQGLVPSQIISEIWPLLSLNSISYLRALLERYQVILPIVNSVNPEKTEPLLIPLGLSKEIPTTFQNHWPLQLPKDSLQFNRIYILEYIPITFLSRLLLGKFGIIVFFLKKNYEQFFFLLLMSYKK
jgi:hypothetical protein